MVGERLGASCVFSMDTCLPCLECLLNRSAHVRTCVGVDVGCEFGLIRFYRVPPPRPQPCVCSNYPYAVNNSYLVKNAFDKFTPIKWYGCECGRCLLARMLE